MPPSADFLQTIVQWLRRALHMCGLFDAPDESTLEDGFGWQTSSERPSAPENLGGLSNAPDRSTSEDGLRWQTSNERPSAPENLGGLSNAPDGNSLEGGLGRQNQSAPVQPIGHWSGTAEGSRLKDDVYWNTINKQTCAPEEDVYIHPVPTPQDRRAAG
ncbi:MAG: hypothetical protein Q9163_004496 [Psora crenata]